MVQESMGQGTTAEDHLDLLVGLQYFLGKALVPYEEFVLGGKTYYLSAGGFVHRKDPDSEEAGECFCGYFDDEFWHHLKNYLKEKRGRVVDTVSYRGGLYSRTA